MSVTSHALDRADVAGRLGVSDDAVRLAHEADLIDLHLDTFIPPRIWGYDIEQRHERALGGRYFMGHGDLPRMTEGGLNAGMWSITTNPFRSPAARRRTFFRNLERLKGLAERESNALMPVRNLAEYRRARAMGRHACMISIQGGNALEAEPEGPGAIPDDLVVRITLVHLTNSVYGASSSPHHKLRSDKGLSDAGREFIRRCNAQRIFVDLAHIHEQSFWDAVDVHDPSQPLLATHTGVDGAKPHWRNLNDAQLKAVADTGGTVGIIFSEAFLKTRDGPADANMVLDHMQHIIDTVGEDHVSIGSDYDGAIIPPRDLADTSTYPVLVQKMLDRDWSEDRIRKVLGGNFLRCLGELRPGEPA